VKKPFIILLMAMCALLIGCPDFDPAAELISISVTRNPTKTEYFVDEEFDPAGLEVTALYSDSTSAVIDDYELSQPDMSSAGQKTITVSYEGKTASFSIKVDAVPTASSLTVTQPPQKTTYSVNEEFDPDGLVVKAYYSNGTSEVLDDDEYGLSQPDMSIAGTRKITVTFGGKTASFYITVNSTSGDTGDLEGTIY